MEEVTSTTPSSGPTSRPRVEDCPQVSRLQCSLNDKDGICGITLCLTFLVSR